MHNLVLIYSSVVAFSRIQSTASESGEFALGHLANVCSTVVADIAS
jgi:hypothetical protein